MKKEKVLKVAKKNIKIDMMVIDYLENGLSVKQIADKNQVNIAYVYRMLHDRNVEIIRDSTKLYMQFAIDYENGMEVEDIAKKYSVCTTSVYRALRQRKVKLRPKKKDLTEHQRAVLERIKNGETQASVAKDLGLSRQRVNQIFKEYMRML